MCFRYCRESEGGFPQVGFMASFSADLDAHAISSSHLVPLDGRACFKKALRDGWDRQEAEKRRKEAEQNFQRFLPGFSSINSFSGLTLAPDEFEREGWGQLACKTDYRSNQVDEVKDVIHSSLHRNALFVGGGNDYKWFIVHEGRLCPLSEHGLEIWGGLPDHEKINFSPKKHYVLEATGLKNVKARMTDFGKIIESLFSGSNFDRVFISSLLERQIPELDHLEVYFAHLNHFLRNLVVGMDGKGKGSVLNIRREPIRFYFVNVAEQFFEVKKDKVAGLFRPRERASKKLTHRNIRSLENICHSFVKEVTSVLNRS